MGVDDELRRASRDLVDRSGKRQTPDGLRRLHRRRRTTKVALPVVAVTLAAGLILWPGADPKESSVDTIDSPAPSAVPGDEEPARIEAGHGPTRVLAADGTPIATIEGDDLIPGEDDLALAIVNELLGIGTGAGSSASQAMAAAGLADRLDEASVQLGDAGLVIETTIGTEAQAAANAAIVQAGLPEELDTALWSIDPLSGATRAVVGPAAIVRRQAGGAIRPAMMAVALENGVAVDERLDNPPALTVELGADWGMQNFRWEPQNFGGQGSAPVTLGEALAVEANTPWAGLLVDGRIDEAFYADVAERFRFNGLDPTVPAMVLGVFEVDAAELARMTAVFASDGSMPDVHMITAVRDSDDRILFERSPGAALPVVEPATRDAVRNAMANAVCCGTATGAQLDTGVDQIGKTGTIPDTASAWFTGATPTLATAVWVGAMDPMIARVGSEPLTGGGVPASIWADYTRAVTGDAPETFPR